MTPPKNEKGQTRPFDLSDPQIRRALGLDESHELVQAFLGGLAKSETIPESFTAKVVLIGKGQAVEHNFEQTRQELYLPVDVFKKFERLVFKVQDDPNDYLIIGIFQDSTQKFFQLQKNGESDQVTEFKGHFISAEVMKSNNRRAVRYSDIVTSYTAK